MNNKKISSTLVLIAIIVVYNTPGMTALFIIHLIKKQDGLAVFLIFSATSLLILWQKKKLHQMNRVTDMSCFECSIFKKIFNPNPISGENNVKLRDLT